MAAKPRLGTNLDELRVDSPICVIGGAHFDIVGRIDAAPVMAVSNPARLQRRPGGVGLNTASVLAALEVQVSLAGPVGADSEGRAVRKHIRARGIGDGLAPLAGHSTGTYAAVLAPDGNLVIGLADLGIQEAVDADWLLVRCRRALQSARCWFLTANLAQATLGELASHAHGRFLAASAVSAPKAARLRPILHQLGLLFCNVAEARALTGLADVPAGELAGSLRRSGVTHGAISAGAEFLMFWSGEKAYRLEPPPMSRIVDVHGAGDALAGATLAALARGMAFEKALRHGIAAAQLTMACAEPWASDLSWKRLARAAATIAPAVAVD